MKGINRVVIAVKDIEKARGIFSELLGIEFSPPEVTEKLGLKAMISWDGGIELISPTKEDSEVARFLKNKGEGVYSVIFNVDNVDQAASRAKAMGIRQTLVIELDQYQSFKKFKEVLLAPEETFGITIALAQIER